MSSQPSVTPRTRLHPVLWLFCLLALGAGVAFDPMRHLVEEGESVSLWRMAPAN